MNVFAMYLHYVLVGFVLVSVVATYFKVRHARKVGRKNEAIMLGHLNVAQEAPGWFALFMKLVAVLIILFCGFFILFALYFLLKGMG